MVRNNESEFCIHCGKAISFGESCHTFVSVYGFVPKIHIECLMSLADFIREAKPKQGEQSAS